MEVYAVERLFRLFDAHKPQMDDRDKVRLAETIVNALIEKTKTYVKFKEAFWKILWNLHLKGKDRSTKTLEDLFSGRWPTVEAFINATEDELDSDCEAFRQNVRLKEFNKITA